MESTPRMEVTRVCLEGRIWRDLRMVEELSVCVRTVGWQSSGPGHLRLQFPARLPCGLLHVCLETWDSKGCERCCAETRIAQMVKGSFVIRHAQAEALLSVHELTSACRPHR